MTTQAERNADNAIAAARLLRIRAAVDQLLADHPEQVPANQLRAAMAGPFPDTDEAVNR